MIDPRLPGLETATDDGAMRAILSRALGPERPPLRAVRHSVLKHAPGKHCVIEYRIEREGEGSERVIGKHVDELVWKSCGTARLRTRFPWSSGNFKYVFGCHGL